MRRVLISPSAGLLFVVTGLVFGLTVFAQTSNPERKVTGNVLTSEREPTVSIELPKSVQHCGADRWMLYDIADCELHAFVEAGQDKKVQRIYWIQFEQYLPSHPELHHDYKSPRHETIGGMDFYVDSGPSATAKQPKTGSDTEHFRALIKAKGFVMPENMMLVRLVRLLDEHKRKELMIIYGEDLAPTGFTAADLDKGGKEELKWPEIADGLVERAKKAISIK